jgi:hypothetical protein
MPWWDSSFHAALENSKWKEIWEKFSRNVHNSVYEEETAQSVRIRSNPQSSIGILFQNSYIFGTQYLKN